MDLCPHRIHAHNEHLDKITAYAEEIVYLRLVGVYLPKEEQQVWIVKRMVDSQYFEHSKIQLISTRQNLTDRLNQNSLQNWEVQIMITAVLLKELVESKIIIVGRYEEINEALLRQIVIKVQLPSVFTAKDQVTLQLLGYRFDPNQRLQNQKLTDVQYTRGNIDLILPILKEQTRQAGKLYDNKDWKNATMLLEPLCFQIETKVKIIAMKNSSFDVKPLQPTANSRSAILHLKLQELTEQSLRNAINSTTDSLLKQNPIQHLNEGQAICYAPQKIYNPHIFIKTPSKNMYLQYFTKGVYQYYHYGDQSFNDQGWGCAYRSLQTLLSWLNIQNYCQLPKMLTITQIQELIDRINLGSTDKLRNTREWIGATEVSWVVKKLTDIDCRIVHISDGKDIIQNCEVFRQHFEKVGSPIMYGGGEYAYSIVGINYCWKLGECEFLILDPHYTGGDSIDKILQKKGLSWRKPADMFKKGIFYNFCLPLI